MTTRSRFSLLIVLSIVLLSVASGSAQAPQPQFDQYGRWINGISEPWMFPEWVSKTDAWAAQEKWLEIQAESDGNSNNQWAGNYFAGSDTHGTYLRWSREKGFVLMHVDKCAAQVMAFSYGSVVADSNRIQLIPARTVNTPTQHEHASGVSLRFVPVTWRGRFLVPENQIAEFGDYVAGLGQYNDWGGNYIDVVEFFEKTDREVAGAVETLARPSANGATKMDLPNVPEGFERFIKKPIDIHVTQVGRPWTRRSENPWWDELVIPATIDRGHAEGVLPKMKFRVADSDETIIATRVATHRSQAIIVRATRKKPCVRFSKDDDCGEIDYPPITIGLRASTSPFRYNR